MISDDVVYMDRATDLTEYVLRDVGPIWKGCPQSKQRIDWVYGQFEQGVLENCLHLLDKCGLTASLRPNIALLCRTIASAVG